MVRSAERCAIPQTRRADWPGSTLAGPVESDADILMTVWLRPGGDLDVARANALGATPVPLRTYQTREALAQKTDTAEPDVAAVRAYCESFGLRFVESHWRSVVIAGSIDNLIAAFGATVAIFDDGEGKRFRNRSGSLSASSGVARIVRGAFGLHQWPRSHRLGALQRHVTPLSAKQVAERYAFPDADGAGQTIAVLQMGGEFKSDDFDRCMQAQAVRPPRPIVKRVDNAALTHELDTTKDMEAALDEQIIAALAPGAQIVIYQVPNTERGFLDGVRTALFDEEYRPSIVSISYGWPEPLWTPAAVDVLHELFIAAALLGVTVFCSSGDNGAELAYDGKPQVLAPASSAFVHACGATTISNASGTEIEAAWERTGGGFSRRFEVPSWQNVSRANATELGVAAGRGVPDVAAQNSPGYCVYLDGVELAAGGTSAVAPMWSALAARINQRIGSSIGFFAPLLYGSAQPIFRDVVQGGNGQYQARAGWNPCTGLGVPIGTAIESVVRGTEAG